MTNQQQQPGQAGGGDRDFPGRTPDEVRPDQGDTGRPGQSPEQEVPSPGGDTDQPGSTPAETPAQPSEPGQVSPD